MASVVKELTSSQVEFLTLCEELFNDRYTEKDVEYMESVNKSRSEPPVVSPWHERGSGYNNSRGSRPRKGRHDDNHASRYDDNHASRYDYKRSRSDAYDKRSSQHLSRRYEDY